MRVSGEEGTGWGPGEEGKDGDVFSGATPYGASSLGTEHALFGGVECEAAGVAVKCRDLACHIRMEILLIRDV